MTEFHISPSQIDTARNCLRRWGFDKIAGLPRGSNKYADRGTAVHNILEGWLLRAEPPDPTTPHGATAYGALKHLPPPMSPGLVVESGGKNIERAWDGVLWSYRKDVQLRGPDGGVWVWDHKTTSDPEGTYAWTPAKLRGHPQSVLYAFDELYDGAPWVQLRWNNMGANKPHKCVPAVLDVDPAECSARFAEWNEFGRNLLTLRKKGVHPIRLAYNVQYCHAFNQTCPYAKDCNITPEQELKSLMTQNTTPATTIPGVGDFMARLAAMGQTQPAAAPLAQVVPVPVQVAPVPVQATTAPNTGLTPPVIIPGAPPQFSPPPGMTPVHQGFQFPPPAVVVAAPVPPPVLNTERIEAVQTFPPVERIDASIDAMAPAATDAGLPPAPVSVPTVTEKPKRTRRTKDQIDADAMAKDMTDPAIEALYADPVPAHATIPAPAPKADRAFRQDLVLAMAANPAYAACDSVALGTRLEVLLALAEGLE